jgi:hypothetical protein
MKRDSDDWSPFLTDEEEISASDLHSSAPWPDG